MGLDLDIEHFSFKKVMESAKGGKISSKKFSLYGIGDENNTI